MSKQIKPQRIDESHSFNINVACIVGDRKAILLKEIYGWCYKNLSNCRNIFNEIPWTYNSAKAYNEKFKYWPEKSIARWLKELEKDKWIYSTDEFNKFRIDRTKWYTINFERYDAAVLSKELSISQNDTWYTCIDKIISQNRGSISQNDTSESPILIHDISQNDTPIPSLTISYPSLNSSRLRENEKITNEDIEDFELLENIEQLEAEKESSKKVAAKKGSFENQEDPNWMEVALAAIEYATGEGKSQWEFMCKSAGGYVDPGVIMTNYFGKQADSSYILRNWKKEIPKMSNWIKNELKTQKQQKQYEKTSTKARLTVEEYEKPRQIKVSKVPSL